MTFSGCHTLGLLRAGDSLKGTVLPSLRGASEMRRAYTLERNGESREAGLEEVRRFITALKH